MTSFPQHLATLGAILLLALFALAMTGPEWTGTTPEIVQEGQ